MALLNLLRSLSASGTHVCKDDQYLEPQTTIYKWLFQLDDSKSLYRKWLLHQTSMVDWCSR